MPTATPTPPPTGTAHLAVLVSDSVVAVGGGGQSDIFVYLRDVDPPVQQLRIEITYDPRIVRVADADGDASNGVQIAATSFFTHSQSIVANRVDNETGRIVFALAAPTSAALHGTGPWRRAGAISWIGVRAGNAPLGIASETHFTSVGGTTRRPSTTQGSTVFVRKPGRMEGRVQLQGRQAFSDVTVSGELTPSRVDRTTTDSDGSFQIVVSHGEGFYTLRAFMPGYLSAESERPVKLSVGRAVQIGATTLYGGDVNSDDRIDIRDLSFIAWHFDEYSPLADINRDGQVDILDLTLTAANFGMVGPTVWHISD